MRRSLPSIAAIYFVMKPPNSVLYVGQSKNLCNRFKRHHCLKKFEQHYDDYYGMGEDDPKVFYIDYSSLSDDQRIYDEYQYIGKLNPPYNIGGTLKDDVQKYTYNLFKILLNLSIVFPKKEIINYINIYSYGSATRGNPLAGSALLQKVILTDYEILKDNNKIIYQFKFDVSETINLEIFQENFTNTIIQNFSLPEDFCEKENIAIITDLTISITSNK
jgi:hypothetical protein